MHEINQHNGIRNPLISILITLLIFFLGFQIIGPVIGGFIALIFFPGNEIEFQKALLDMVNHPEIKVSYLIMQGFGVLIGMVLIPYFFLRKQGRGLTQYFHSPYAQPSLIIPVLVIVFMGLNSVFIKWNAEFDFPFWIEDWAKPMEDKLSEATLFITKYDSTAQMVLAFVVIAILPAIGEEIIFRGMIQNDFIRATGKIHLSIWVSAFLFSAIHIQFYGLIPRMLLGALFGYLYFWSGNLWMPVLAHFINNGFTLVSLYLFQKGTINIDMEKVEPNFIQVLFSTIFTAVLIYAYRTYFQRHPKGDIPE